MKTKKINTQTELDSFLKGLNDKRLEKNINQQILLKESKVSSRSWWQWTRKLKKKEEREFPNPSHVQRLERAIKRLKKRPRLEVGRPPKMFIRNMMRVK